MSYGETTAWMCGLFAGAIVGAVAAVALLWRVFENSMAIGRENKQLRVLLNELMLAECTYRDIADRCGGLHDASRAAWQRLRAASKAARTFLFDRRSAK